MTKKKAKSQKGGDKVTPQETMLMPTTNDVVNLARRRKAAKKQQASLAGTIGEAIAQAVEKKHLDRKAFGIACQLDAMSDERLAITLPHLRRYIDDLKLDERASAQEEMFEAGADKDHGEGGKPRIVAGRDTEQKAGEAAGA